MHRIVKVSVIWLMLGLLVVHIPLRGDGDSSARSPQLLENIESLEIVAGSVLDIQTLNPCVASDEHTQRVLSLVYDSLAYINRTTGSAEPGLALSWTSSDGLTWIVKLRENLKWHDGTNLTADDVVFTYNFLLNPENPLKTSEYFSFLKWVRIPGTSDKNEDYWEAVQKVDRSTVKFVLNKTVWDFGITILSLPILKKEIWKEHWGDATSWNLDHDVTTGTSKSIGSGPYKLISWKPGRELILVPNPDYHRTVKSSIRILKYSSYPDLLEGVRKREVSLVFHPVSLEFLPEFTQIGSFSAFPYRAREITFLGFNLEKYFEGYDEGSGYQQRSSIDDPVTYPVKAAGADAGLQFRNAAGYLLPNNLVEVKYPNILLWENSIVQRGSQYYNASVKSYSQDIEEAVRLLNIANYKDADGDEWREDYSGRKMGHDGVVKIYIEKKETVNQQIAMWFCANLRSAGVNADTFPIQVLNYRDYDLFLYTLHLDENFEYLYKLLNSKYDYTDGVTNGENLWRYRNPDTDNLTTSMLSTQSFGNTIRYLQGIISIHLPLIPLYSRILYDVVDIARVSVNPVVNESILEKHNIISMTVSDGVSIEAYGVPFRLNAIGGSISEIIVRVSQNENPVVDTQVMLSIFPSDAIALDAPSKQTDSAGCAFFSLTLTKSMGLVQVLSVECLLPSQNILKRFYLVLEPFEIEVNILSEPFVKGLGNNTYTFSFEIRNSGVPVKDAFTQVLYVSDSRIKPLIGENLSDGSGVASLMFLVTEDYTENAPLQITFALSVAGGEEKAYSVTLVVTAPGSLEVSIAAACQGVNWKTGRGEITGLVNYEGNPVGAMTVKCGIMEVDGIFEIESQERVTDSQGAVNFSVIMNQMPRKSRFFHYYLVVATSNYHGAVYTRGLLQVPDGITISAVPDTIEIKGEKGTTAILTLKVEAEGTGIGNAWVFGWKNMADSRLWIVGPPGLTNGTGSREVKIQIMEDYREDTFINLTFRVLFWGRDNSCSVGVRIAKASIPVVSISLSESEIEGVSGNSVIARVHVSKDGLPLSAVNVTLVLSSSTNLEVVPGHALTDEGGDAEFEITVTSNFPREANITVNAKALVSGNFYTGAPVYLQIFPAGTAAGYTVTLSASTAEITGKEGEGVVLTGKVMRGNAPVPGMNFTVEITGIGEINIEPKTQVTNQNGEAYFTLTITRNQEKDVEVILRGKINVSGKEYFSQPVTLKIKAYGEQKIPGFELGISLIVLALATWIFIMKKGYIGKRFKA